MQKSELPEGIRTLQKWYTTKTLRFEYASKVTLVLFHIGEFSSTTFIFYQV